MKKQTMMLGGLMLLVGGATVYFAVDYERNRPLSNTRTETAMGDGTALVVEHVSFGTKHAFQVVPGASGIAALFGGRRHDQSEVTQSDKLYVWMSRHDVRSRRALDFDWWSHSTVVDEHGCEIRDESGRRVAASANSNSTVSGERPFRPLAGDGPASRFDRIAVASIFPAIRAGPTFRMRVYNTESSLVAELDVPSPRQDPNPYPVWEPEPLPATQTAGDLEVTLTRLAGVQLRSDPSGALRTQVHPHLSFTQHGQPAKHWSTYRTQFHDPLGNRGDSWSVNLCPREKAWKLHLKLVRTQDAEFDSSEEWSVRNVTLPKPASSERLTASAVVQDVTMKLIGAGGGGAATYTGVTLKSGSSRHSGNIQWGEKQWPYEVALDATNASMSVTSELPHIVALASNLSENHNYPYLLVTDNRGRKVRVEHQHAWSSDMPMVWFLDLEPGAESIDLKFVVQKARTVEFTVKPPPFEPVALFQHADGLARAGKWDDAAAAFESALDAYADNPWHWYRSACLPLETGNIERYGAHCERMLELFGDNSDVFVLERTAKACLLSPTPVVDVEKLLPLADRAIEVQPTNPWFLLAKGIVEHRSERWDSAAEWLHKSLHSPNGSIYSRSMAGLFLAMAQQRLDRPEDARQSLQSATDIIDKDFPKLDAGNLGDAWHDWLMAQIVRREAESLIAH